MCPQCAFKCDTFYSIVFFCTVCCQVSLPQLCWLCVNWWQRLRVENSWSARYAHTPAPGPAYWFHINKKCINTACMYLCDSFYVHLSSFSSKLHQVLVQLQSGDKDQDFSLVPIQVSISVQLWRLPGCHEFLAALGGSALSYANSVCLSLTDRNKRCRCWRWNWHMPMNNNKSDDSLLIR